MTIEFIPAICPNCGGELRVPEDRKIVKCMYCGHDIILHETKNNNLQPSVENWLKLADAVKEANPEEAYGYYQKVLEVEPENWRAWFGKVKTINVQYIMANSQSKLSAMLVNQKIFEIINDLQKAIQYCPEIEMNKLLKSAIIELIQLAMKYRVNILFFSTIPNINFFELFEKEEFYFSLMDYLLFITPQNHPDYDYVGFAELGMDECKSLLQRIPSRGNYSSWEHQIKDRNQNYLDKIKKIYPGYQPK